MNGSGSGAAAESTAPETAERQIVVWRWFTGIVRVDRRKVDAAVDDLITLAAAVADRETPVDPAERAEVAAALRAVVVEMHGWCR